MTVDAPGAALTSVPGINNSGTAVGYGILADGVTTVGFTYDVRKRTFGPLPPPAAPPGGFPFTAFAINERGTIVGPLDNSPDTTVGAILAQKGGYTTFAVPDYARTLPRAIGPTGLVTGYAQKDTGETTGFIYDSRSGGLTLFTVPGSLFIIPQGINARGQVVGSVNLPPGGAYGGSPPGTYGFLRETDGSFVLFRVNGAPTRARGITDAGLMTGFVSPAGAFTGFTAPAPRGPGYQAITVPATALFMVPGAVSTAPQAIDNSGRIVGTWNDVDGNQRGFVALPPPKAK